MGTYHWYRVTGTSNKTRRTAERPAQFWRQSEVDAEPGGPGHDLYAFGAIDDAQAQFIEIEMRSETGEIIQRYFPSNGPTY